MSYIDEKGQAHRDLAVYRPPVREQSTGSSSAINVFNRYPVRERNTSSSSSTGAGLLILACIIGLSVFAAHQCNTGNTGQSNTASRPAAPKQYFANVLSSALNVRSGPSADYGIIGKLYQNNRVEIIERYNNGWFKIKYRSGAEGFVNGDYLSK
jgi:uncharacterized protein YgiM (DUF1202 family)